MTVEPYRAAHLETLVLQPAQSHLQPLFEPQYARTLELSDAYTARVGDKVIGCFGLYTVHARRGIAWTLIAGDCGAHFTAIHKGIARYLAASPMQRIEAHVDRDFAAGQRWARLLGFVNETPGGMPAFTPDGRTCDLYVRLNPRSFT